MPPLPSPSPSHSTVLTHSILSLQLRHVLLLLCLWAVQVGVSVGVCTVQVGVCTVQVGVCTVQVGGCTVQVGVSVTRPLG